jgi:outer membrane receptor protein involved in Fe transport
MAAYLYDQAKVREFDANPVLVGKYLAQVPKHRGSVQVVYTHPKLADLAFAIQSLGLQFDDDLNVRTVPGLSEPGLPGYTVASFSASRAVGRNFEGFFTVQNMFDKEYFVGTLPTTVGSPRIVSGGVRVRFAGRPRP